MASRSTVLELDHLPVSQVCLLALFVLATARRAAGHCPVRSDGLRGVIIIEEAHTVAGSSSAPRPSEENPDPKAFASEYVCQMLAELRALGVGVVISNQTPSAVAPDVLKNTGTKLAFRQVDAVDRELLAGAMLLTPTEMEDLARLSPGEAYLYTEGYHRPRKIRALNPHTDLDLSPPTDAQLRAVLHGQSWYRESLVLRREAELGQLAEALDAYDRQMARIAGRAAHLVSRAAGVEPTSPPPDDGSREAGVLARELRGSLNDLLRGPVRQFLPEGNGGLAGAGLDRVAAALRKRVDTIGRATRGCLEVLERCSP